MRLNTEEEIRRVHSEWHDTITRDLSALVALYAENAVFESPAVYVLSGGESGLLHGRKEIEAFFGRFMDTKPDNSRMLTVRSCGVLVATSFLLAACMSGESDGLTKARADAGSYREAHARCWVRAYSLLGGNAMDMARQREFDSCMARDGWQDQRALFGRGQDGPQSAGQPR
jgi:hypothetical protein